MSSGNPFGLSEINHFGSMQRVGGKAAGFINKKFFHPSNLRNQERLWKAQTEDARLQKLQHDAELRREEERHVEELKKQMYLRGQGSASDALFATAGSTGPGCELSTREKREQKAAFDEFKRRKALLRQDKDGEAGEDALTDGVGAAEAEAPEKILAPSMYKEDVKVCGHDAVWGSWFAREEMRWGFACCKTLERKTRCPFAPPELVKEKVQRADRGKRRRKGGRENAHEESEVASNASKFGGQCDAHDSGGVQESTDTTSAGISDEVGRATSNDSECQLAFRVCEEAPGTFGKAGRNQDGSACTDVEEVLVHESHEARGVEVEHADIESLPTAGGIVARQDPAAKPGWFQCDSQGGDAVEHKDFAHGLNT